MKKFVMAITILVMVLGSTLGCFAAVPTDYDDSQVNPMYVATQSHAEIFKISSKGLAKMDVALTPFSKTTLDKVNVTFVIKNSAGTSVYNKTYDVPWSSLYAKFTIMKEYQLSKSDIYEFQATYRCYKNNSLVETIKSSKLLKSY